jgi:hypothetical protein
MRLLVLVPSADYYTNAGARIRYGRIASPLLSLGSSLAILPIENFQPDQADYDVLLLSKCHDARATLAAIGARACGAQVGVDLFDDYFSHHEDSRMGRYRSWLVQLMPRLTFALCSTPAMANVARSYRPDLPVHVMNDPSPPIDRDPLIATLDSKRQRVLSDQAVDICWFGMGRNPHFPIGLRDLGAFGSILAAFAQHRIHARLTVLTNLAALDAENIALINRLPLPVVVEPWTEAREAEMLESATIAFLPVNAQNFSIAKSLNRAWTALAAGCQVLSVGYPLYAPLQSLIYRDVDALLHDIRGGSTKLGLDTIDRLFELHGELANAASEAAELTAFLGALPPPARGAPQLLALVHGALTSGAVDKFAKANDAITIRSPHSSADFAHDVIFSAARPGDPLTVLLGEKAQALASQHRPLRLQSMMFDSLRGYRALEGTAVPADPRGNWSGFCAAAQIAASVAATRDMLAALNNLFGPVEVVWSEKTAWLPTPVLEL